MDSGLGAFEGTWTSSDDGSDLIEFAMSVFDAGLAILVMVGKKKFDAGATGFDCHWGRDFDDEAFLGWDISDWVDARSEEFATAGGSDLN